MAKSPEIVKAFLLGLSKKLDPLNDAEIEYLKELKADDVKTRGEADDGKINPWDIKFYQR